MCVFDGKHLFYFPDIELSLLYTTIRECTTHQCGEEGGVCDYVGRGCVAPSSMPGFHGDTR